MKVLLCGSRTWSDYGAPDLVVAFHRDSSRGTAHTISLARRAGIEVIMYEPPSVAR